MKAQGRFNLEVGAFMRQHVRWEIEEEARGRGLQIEASEKWGLLKSVYNFTVVGEESVVAEYLADTKYFLAKLAENDGL